MKENEEVEVLEARNRTQLKNGIACWLMSHRGYKITHIAQSEHWSPGPMGMHITLTIFYKEASAPD
jgi:hypothetical protein